MKSFILAFVTVFIFVFVYDWVFHGMILKETYASTMSLWRPEAEMVKYFKWFLAGQFLSAFAITALVARAAYGVKCGLGIGALIGLVVAAGGFITYAVQPIPFHLMLAWVIGSVIQGALTGFIAAIVYFKSGGSGCCKNKTLSST